MEQKKIEIYALCCPDTKSVMYIGKAKCSQKRLKSHLLEHRRRTPLYGWIASLKGRVPFLKVLATVAESDWQDAERMYISEYRSRGDLLNVADGGEEPHCPLHVRQANGAKNAKIIKDNPNKRRIWEIKIEIGLAIRRGELKERHKEKLRIAAMKAPHIFGEYANL